MIGAVWAIWGVAALVWSLALGTVLGVYPGLLLTMILVVAALCVWKLRRSGEN